MDISRDGTLILFNEGGVGGGPRGIVYLRRTDGSAPVPIGNGEPIALSPNGEWAIIRADPTTPYLDLIPTRAGSSRRIEHPRLASLSDARWLPDGKRVIVRAVEPQGKPRLYLLGLDDGVFEGITPPGATVDAWFPSPDGTTVAVASDHEVQLYPLSGGEPQNAAGVTGRDRLVAWIEAGLLFSDDPDPFALRKVIKLDPASGRREDWKEILPRDPAGVMNMGRLVVTPDGRSYGYSCHRAVSDLNLVEGLI